MNEELERIAMAQREQMTMQNVSGNYLPTAARKMQILNIKHRDAHIRRTFYQLHLTSYLFILIKVRRHISAQK